MMPVKPIPDNYPGVSPYLIVSGCAEKIKFLKNTFNAEGWGGQQIIIIPTENMVVVFTGANYVGNPPNDEIMSSYILPAL